jgi:PKD repeat protein
MIFSSNGKYLIKSNTNLPPPPIIKGIEIYEFDKKNGNLKYLYSIDDPSSPLFLGLCFSYNNQNIFIADRDSGVNMFKFNPKDSLETVTSIKKIILEGFSGPLKKMPYSHGIALSRIDELGVSSLDFIVDADNFDSVKILEKKIDLNYLWVSLPNLNESYYYTPSINFTVKLNCVLNTVQFYGQDTFQASSHSWEIFKNGSNPITASVKTPLIEFEDTGVYHIRYIANNGIRSDTVTKEVTILPKIEKGFLGNDTGWCNVISSQIVLQAPSGMHCYEWNTGEVGNTITADSAGIYIAKITTPNFCVIYDTILISVDTVQTVPNDFLGDDKFWCENLDTSVLLAAPADMQQYLWSVGEVTQSIIVSEDGEYFVTATKRNQCESGGNLFVTDTIKITLLNAPEKPTLIREDDSLFINISNNYTYNWFRNNSLLGDTTEYLILPDTGYYFLKVTNLNGCINHSDTLHAATLGIDNPLFNNIKLYPNPTDGVFNIEVLNGFYSFEIIDIKGKLIKKGKLNKGANQIDISHFVDGIYFITIQNNEQSITYKIIKQSE